MLITNKTQNNRIQFLFGDTFKTGISSARSLPLYSPFIFSFGFNFLICTFIFSGSFVYIFFKNSQTLFFIFLIITFIFTFFSCPILFSFSISFPFLPLRHRIYVLEGSACRQNKCDVATAEREKKWKKKTKWDRKRKYR